MDPLTKSYPWYTPYQFAGNKPIWAIDIDGLEEWKVTGLDGSESNTYGPYIDQSYAQENYDNSIDPSSITPNDSYEKGILDKDISFSRNYGWVDQTHAFTDTKRKDVDIGIGNLWSKILNEKGNSSFDVNYTQVASVFGFKVGETGEFRIKGGLSIQEKREVALAIVQDVSLKFEALQSFAFWSGSSFEPADLPSNILSFYRTVYNDLDSDKLKDLIGILNPISSLRVYRQYPGTFTDGKYKNRSFSPKYFNSIFSPNDFNVPAQLSRVKPAKMGGVLNNKTKVRYRWF